MSTNEWGWRMFFGAWLCIAANLLAIAAVLTYGNHIYPPDWMLFPMPILSLVALVGLGIQIWSDMT